MPFSSRVGKTGKPVSYTHLDVYKRQEFAHFNDDVLFGENWNNQDIDVKTRSIITVVALMASGITDSSLKYHLQNAKNHGVTQKEIAAVITPVSYTHLDVYKRQECVCVQSISYSLLCRWFRAAVLPQDKELETALFHRLNEMCIRDRIMIYPT